MTNTDKQEWWEKGFDSRLDGRDIIMNDADVVSLKSFLHHVAESEYKRGIADMWKVIAQEVGESETGFNQGIGEVDLDIIYKKREELEEIPLFKGTLEQLGNLRLTSSQKES